MTDRPITVGDDDSVPAWLSPGEVVITRAVLSPGFTSALIKHILGMSPPWRTEDEQ